MYTHGIHAGYTTMTSLYLDDRHKVAYTSTYGCHDVHQNNDVNEHIRFDGTIHCDTVHFTFHIQIMDNNVNDTNM